MRLIVFFDLPTTSIEYKKAYIKFRRFLLKDGYDMVQWSVYSRITNGADSAEKHLRRLQQNLPYEGSVRSLLISEKQFSKIQILVGVKKPQEKAVNNKQMLLF